MRVRYDATQQRNGQAAFREYPTGYAVPMHPIQVCAGIAHTQGSQGRRGASDSRVLPRVNAELLAGQTDRSGRRSNPGRLRSRNGGRSSEVSVCSVSLVVRGGLGDVAQERLHDHPRPRSPTPVCSTLTTSAPSQASAWVHEVPSSYWVLSRMRIPSRAGISTLPIVRQTSCLPSVAGVNRDRARLLVVSRGRAR